MKNKDIPILAFLNFLSLLISCVAAELFTKLLIRFVILFVELDFASASAVRLFSLLLISTGIFCFLGYKEGYRSASFVREEAIPAVGIAALVHFLICLPTRFWPWFSGPTRHIAGFLSLGENYNAEERMAEIPFVWLAVVGLCMALVWAALYLLSHYFGFKNRIRDREILTKKAE